MLLWTVTDHKKSIPKFTKQGVGTLKGLTVLQHSEAAGQPRGFTLVRVEDLRALHVLAISWADSVRIDEVVPVMDEEETKVALKGAVVG